MVPNIARRIDIGMLCMSTLRTGEAVPAPLPPLTTARAALTGLCRVDLHHVQSSFLSLLLHPSAGSAPTAIAPVSAAGLSPESALAVARAPGAVRRNAPHRQELIERFAPTQARERRMLQACQMILKNPSTLSKQRECWVGNAGGSGKW